jgi:hypothetical protein
MNLILSIIIVILLVLLKIFTNKNKRYQKQLMLKNEELYSYSKRYKILCKSYARTIHKINQMKEMKKEIEKSIATIGDVNLIYYPDQNKLVKCISGKEIEIKTWKEKNRSVRFRLNNKKYTLKKIF